MPKDIDDELLDTTLQQRADYIPLEDLENETSASGELFPKICDELTNRGLRTIVGPRGCGKTHMMRYSWLLCQKNSVKPFAVYASFNRYFRLEPLLSSHPGALQQFHSWVLARILIATRDSCKEWGEALKNYDQVFLEHSISNEDLVSFVARIERNHPLDDEQLAFSASLSIEQVQSVLNCFREAAGRKHTVLLMDDAALTLTPDYLIEFLDIVRSLKSTTIAPKASVYPGTTEVSPKFHVGQDSIAIPVWISVIEHNYDKLMQDIALKRVKNLSNVPSDVQSLLRFASFGIPRAYLTMLDEFLRGNFKNSQQATNSVINAHLAARIGEYKSLSKKIPKFENLILTGEKVLTSIAREIKEFNSSLVSKHEKQLTYGVREDELTPMVHRMFNLLIEAGLIFDDGTVKHGTPERIYRKYLPHTALLVSIRALSSSAAGGSIKQILDAISFRNTKHPIRKSLSNVVPEVDFQVLSFSLPKCASCGTMRLTDNQKFCHSCGHLLVDASTFNQCLDAALSTVPGLTAWQKTQISNNLPKLKTIRDYLAKQDPAAELLTVRGFGHRRTAKIVDVLESFIDDYLS